MHFNKKHIAGGIALLLLLWTANIIYYKSHVLKEPLFIKHYYDVKKGMNSFRLHYIDNINSEDRVVGIVFPEIGEQQIYCSEFSQNADGRYYELKILTVNIFNGDVNSIPEEYKNKVITKARIMLSKGKVMDVDIGKIYLYGDEIENRHLQGNRVSSSSDNTGSAYYATTKDIIIKDIDSKFYNDLKDILKITINEKELSKDIFPIELKEGEALDIRYGFEFSKDDIRKNNVYDFSIDILTEDSQGNKGSNSSFLNRYLWGIRDFHINSLKNSKGGK